MTDRTSHGGDGSNIQPGMLVELMVRSEPCLFHNQSPVAVEPRDVPPQFVVAQALMRDVARWHAQLQVSFDRMLSEEITTEEVPR